jgi:hypothetical protein
VKSMTVSPFRTVAFHNGLMPIASQQPCRPVCGVKTAAYEMVAPRHRRNLPCLRQHASRTCLIAPAFARSSCTSSRSRPWDNSGTTDGVIAQRGKLRILEPDLLKRMRSTKPSIRVAEHSALGPAQALGLAHRHNHGDRLAAPRKLDLLPRFNFVDDARQLPTRVSDRVAPGHSLPCVHDEARLGESGS